MIENATVEIYVPVITQNDEGTSIKTIPETPTSTIRIDVQPYTADENEIALWGINTRRSDIKKSYLKYNPLMVENQRVKITLDGGGPAEWYDVRATNIWPGHMKVIFTPIQGKA